MKINKYLIAFFVVYFIAFLDVIQVAYKVDLHIGEQWISLCTMIVLVLVIFALLLMPTMFEGIIKHKGNNIHKQMFKHFNTYVISIAPMYIMLVCAAFMFNYQMFYGAIVSLSFALFFFMLRKLQLIVSDQITVLMLK